MVMSLTTLRIAVRDLRASWTRFLFVIVAVAAGVGSLTGVRGFSESFRTMLFRESRTLIASDLFIRIFSQPTPEQRAAIDALQASGVTYTEVTETLSMVASDSVPEPALVTVKAVDPELYPFYGQIAIQPAGRLADALQANSAVVSDDLLLRLRVANGQTVRIGGQAFRIAGVLVNEPDRMSGSFGVGPRILISRASLERTGLVGVGSRASQRILFRLGNRQLQEVEAALRRVFPEALYVNFREINPNVQRSIQRAISYLSLVSLIALIIGAIGVATAMHAHLQTRMDSIAIIKSIGGRSSHVLAIYAAQTVLLGIAGGMVGVAVGYAAQGVFPALIERFLQVRPDPAFSPATAVQGLSLGVLTTLLFTVPPLLSVRDIRPAVIFRRDMPEVRPGLRARLRLGARSAALGLLVCIGLAAVAASLVSGTWLDAARIGGTFVLGIAVSLLALAAVSTVLTILLQALVLRMPRLPMTARHALANLYRPGSQSRAVLTALGVGVMFTLTVYLVQRSVLDEIRRSAPPGMANVFFIDITPEQRDALLALIRNHPGLERSPDVIATVSCRLEAVNGVPVDQLPLAGRALRRFRMARNISAEDTMPPGTELVRGKWWDDPQSPQISISPGAARNLRVDIGSTLRWTAYGKTIEARVAAIHRTDERRLRGMLEFHMNRAALADLPTVHYASARVRNEAIGALQRAVYERFPTVTVINVADILDRVQEVVDQIALVIRFISGFAIFAGAIILASSVAGTRFRRVREMAIFKTLGATRARIVAMFSTEFLVLGVAAGVIGSLLATAFTWLVLKRFFEEVPFRFDWTAVGVSIVATAVVAAVAGWLASFRILGQKPLEVLRGE
jgi:putative ABC transport system permease protein